MGDARLPIELIPPSGFEPENLRTWPRVEGRLEFVDGRLLYMPPCGEEQAVLAAQTAHLLSKWAERHPGFDVGGNDAGLRVGKDVRGADAVVWKRVRTPTPDLSLNSPLLAAEVAGADDAEDESALLKKGKAYLRHGVGTVWLVLPETRDVVVMRPDSIQRFGIKQRVPAPTGLRGLSIKVAELYSVL